MQGVGVLMILLCCGVIIDNYWFIDHYDVVVQAQIYIETVHTCILISHQHSLCIMLIIINEHWIWFSHCEKIASIFYLCLGMFLFSYHYNVNNNPHAIQHPFPGVKTRVIFRNENHIRKPYSWPQRYVNGIHQWTFKLCEQQCNLTFGEFTIGIAGFDENLHQWTNLYSYCCNLDHSICWTETYFFQKPGDILNRLPNDCLWDYEDKITMILDCSNKQISWWKNFDFEMDSIHLPSNETFHVSITCTGCTCANCPGFVVDLLT